MEPVGLHEDALGAGYGTPLSLEASISDACRWERTSRSIQGHIVTSNPCFLLICDTRLESHRPGLITEMDLSTTWMGRP